MIMKRPLSVFNNHRDRIECPVVKEFLESLDKINKLSIVVNRLEAAIMEKYPLLHNINIYNCDNDKVNGEYVYYINNKHQSTLVRD